MRAFMLECASERLPTSMPNLVPMNINDVYSVRVGVMQPD